MLSSPLVRRTITATIVSLTLIAVLLVAGAGALPRTTASAGQAGGRAPGSGIVFIRSLNQYSELWIADADGQNQRQLASRMTDFSIRPGGAEIAYSAQPENQPSRLEIVDTASGATRLLLAADDATAYTPVWSPADGVIVYERRTLSSAGVGTPKLWLLGADGSELGPVVKGSDVVAYGAQWSADGTRLGFIDPLRDEIVIFNFSDTLRRVPFSGEFDWSPDGKKLAVSALSKGENGYVNKLMLYDLTTEQEIELTNPPDADDFTPRWSPDGTKLAFIRRDRENPRGQIALLEVAEVGQADAVRVLTTDPAVDNTDPQWAPDGSRVVWTQLQIGVANAPASLWQISPDGGEATLLIDNAMQGRWIK